MSVRTLRYNTMNQHITKSALASTDRDALAFLEAAKIYNTNQQRAIVNLVRSLKRVGLWSKMKAIYPFVGGTASTHKWNLKDPRDSDAAFRLTFSGGWTHSANGADPNGTSAYADTKCTPSSSLSLNSMHISIYHRENRGTSDAYAVSMGVQKTDGTGRTWIIPKEGSPPGANTSMAINTKFVSGQIDSTTFADSTTIGYYLASRTTSTNIVAYKDGLNKSSNTTFTSDSLATYPIYIGAYSLNNTPGAAGYYSTLQIAFATIGDGLTDTDATNLYNIVDLYQKRLGRAA